jgi:glycosyltransferase involved in cell wall biosynthesis
MKILHVVQGYTPAIGGTEHLIQRVSEELVTQFGDEVTIFTTNCYSAEAFSTPSLPRMHAGWEEINGVRLRRFPVASRISHPFVRLSQNLRLPGSQYFRTIYNGPIIPGLRTAIQRADFDLAVTASFPLLHMFTTLHAAHRTRRPCVMIGCLHPADAWGYDRPSIYRAIQKADAYVALTAHEANYVVSRRASPEKVTVIGAGTDLSPFEDINQMTARQHLDIPADVPLIGFVGQVAWRKGVETLVRAMRAVWQHFPDAHLLIAGAKTLYEERLAAVLAGMPPEERQKVLLRYNFPETDKPYMFAALDVLAYPSSYESFGIAYIEAWAVEKPVIGCKNGAVPFVIDAGRDGLLINFDDSDALGEAILILLQNPAWARRLGQHGRQKVLERFNWPEIARRFRQVYLGAIERCRSK